MSLDMNLTKRPYRRAAETREHVLDVAEALFYAHGIHAVGVDRIAEAAEVTTTTLYRLFGSKDGLVLAYLQRMDERWFTWFDEAVSKGGLPQFFDEMEEKCRNPEVRGCAFRMALTEYPSGECDVNCLVLDNKQRVRDRIRDVLVSEGYTDAELLADQLMLIGDGIEASAAGRGPDSPPGPGPALVRKILGVSA
jgi:AcrR family transcriptional regulator